MSTTRRAQFALAAMTVAVLALLIDALENGWSILGGAGIVCLALAIVAQVVVLGRLRATH